MIVLRELYYMVESWEGLGRQMQRECTLSDDKALTEGY